MSKEIEYMLRVLSMVIIVAGICSLKTTAIAGQLYGCPKDRVISSKPIKCLDDSEAAVVQEGYIVEGNKVILDTLSDREKSELNIKGDNKAIIIVYKSDDGKEASLMPGVSQSGKQLKKDFLELTYYCGDVMANKSLQDECAPIRGSYKKAVDAYRGKTEQETRKSLKRSIDESRPIFYKQHKEMGFDDASIDRYWEEQKKAIYEEYNYDPQTDTFKSAE